MGRLIDAEDFENEIRKYADSKMESTEYANGILAVIGLLREQQTSYDVDKVVEELEEYPHGDYINVVTMGDIIEIVKGGK